MPTFQSGKESWEGGCGKSWKSFVYNPLAKPEVAEKDGLGLRIWGGSASGPMLSTQSWEAESSGTGLTDNATDKFQRLTDAFDHGVQRPRSLILLAHDTAATNVARVAQAVQQMEAYATPRGVQIQYHTKSSLFEVVRGFSP